MNMIRLMITGVLLTALFAAGCIQLDYDREKTASAGETKIDFRKVETFREGFDIMQQIDSKHKANFKKEMLGGPVIKIENIGPMRADLMKFLEAMDSDMDTIIELKNNANRTESDIVVLFIGARLEMLNAQEEFLSGYKHGDAGLVGDGFFCTEKGMILESTQHFENSIRHAGIAQGYLDLILSGGEDITWEHIGVNENKPAFYDSPLHDMTKQIGMNRKIVAHNCPLGTEQTYVIIDEGEDNPLAKEVI